MPEMQVLITVRARPEPNYYSDSNYDAPTGMKFVPAAISPDTDPVPYTPNKVTWHQIPDGHFISGLWVPDIHHTKPIRYLQEVDGETPPSDNPVVLVTLTHENGDQTFFVPREQ